MNFLNLIQILCFMCVLKIQLTHSTNLLNKFNSIKLKLLKNTENRLTSIEQEEKEKAGSFDTETNKRSLPIDKQYVDTLFAKELAKIENEGPKNRFWNFLIDILEPQQVKKRNNTTSKSANHRGIFVRQANLDSQTQASIAQSPLIVNSKVQLSSQSSANARIIDAKSEVGLAVSKQLVNDAIKAGADPKETLKQFQAPDGFCPFKSSMFCNPNEKFPTFDGSCNNLAKPWFGKAEIPYKRYLETSYDDGISSPRSRSVTGNPLPNPRVISRALFNDNSALDNSITHIVATFGQFLAHDFTSASLASDNFGRAIDCSCGNTNEACMSVNMPPNENIMRMSCMRFTRSSAAFSNFDCRLGHREQLNLLTSFIDATQVYGPSVQRSKDLRSNQGGKLRSSPGVMGRETMPQAQDGACRKTSETVKCFAGGEGRVNENLGLSSIQSLFLREHNRIAQSLSSINPQWNDERLFSEARKIVIGIYQHVVFSEWLPIIIGWNTAGAFDLVPLNSNKYYTGYNPETDPTIANEFATAAFRFGHTLVRNQMIRVNSNNQQTSPKLNLFDVIFTPVEAYNAQAGGLESILLGLINDPASQFDTNLASTLQNRLFEVSLSDGSVIANDLAATNINRGRDHGISSYNSIRERCGLRKASNFQDLSDSISPEKIQLLSQIYEHVDDIDYYVGGLSETPINGAVVGPAFGCIIANQFKDLKTGDRFFYENGPGPTAFTIDQLSEIKSSSMSRILCDNTDINLIQPNPFLQPGSPNNGRISCASFKRLDLTRWKE